MTSQALPIIYLKNISGSQVDLTYGAGSTESYTAGQAKELFLESLAFQDARGRAYILQQVHAGTMVINADATDYSKKASLIILEDAADMKARGDASLPGSQIIAAYDTDYLLDTSATQDNVPEGTTYKRITQAQLDAIGSGGGGSQIIDSSPGVPTLEIASANFVYYVRFSCPSNITAANVACILSTAPPSGQTDTLRLGIYNSSSNKIAETAALTITSAASTGYLVGSLQSTVGLTAGSQYFLALHCISGWAKFAALPCLQNSTFYKGEEAISLPSTAGSGAAVLEIPWLQVRA